MTDSAQSEDETRSFPCLTCGSALEFHIGQQRLRCEHCGASRDICGEGSVDEQDLLEALKRVREQSSLASVETQKVACRSCGAEVLFDGTLTTAECAYCGVETQRDAVHTAVDRFAVEGVLPFQITREQARQNLGAWVASLWFAPNRFRKRGISGTPQGCYLPYWSFDSLAFCNYSGQRGDHYYVTVGTGDKRRQERRTRWTPVSGSFHRFFDDVLIPATEGLPDKLLRELEPWPLAKLSPFRAEHLAGFQARTYDLPLDAGFKRAQLIIRDRLTAEARRRIGGDEQSISQLSASHDALSYKHLLLPLYLLSYRFNDKVYRVFVNAGTGEVSGERPYSVIKIALAVLAALAVGIPLLRFFLENA